MSIEAPGSANVNITHACKSHISAHSRLDVFLLIFAGWYGCEMGKESDERFQEYNMGILS